MTDYEVSKLIKQLAGKLKRYKKYMYLACMLYFIEGAWGIGKDKDLYDSMEITFKDIVENLMGAK